MGGIPMYLSFLDDAAQAFVVGFAVYERQLALDPNKRDARSVAGAIIDIHTAIDKGTKHALSLVSPTLIITKPDAKLIQEVFKTQRATNAPSIFATATHHETLSMMGVLNRARGVLSPDISADIWDQFSKACEELHLHRNQAVHGELFGDSTDLIGTLTRVLSRFRPVMLELCPRLLEIVFEKNNQLESRLKGVENELDTAWQVLLDYVAENRGITIPFAFYLSLLPSQEGLNILFTRVEPLGPGVTGEAMIPGSAASGLFVRALPSEHARFWRTPAPKGETQRYAGIGAMLAEVHTSQNVGEYGLIVAEDGALSISQTSVWASLSLENLNKPYLSAAAVIVDLRVAASAEIEAMTVKGRLKAGRTLTALQDAGELLVTGTVYLKAEFVYEDAIGDSPAGSTCRRFVGAVTIGEPE